MTLEVMSIGDVNVDLISSKLRDMPERDSQVIASDIVLSSGGCAANFAKAASRLGLRTRFIGKVGDDFFGDFLRDDFSGVDLKLSIGGKTGVTLAVTLEDDTRSFITYPGSNSELRVNDIDFNLIEGRCLHIASFFLQGLREGSSKILDYAHSKGMLVSFDTGWDPRGWSNDDVRLVEEILGEVDVFFPNMREGIAITGARKEREICEKLMDMGPRIIGLKKGREGSYIATDDKGYTIPPYKIKPVDTTGAGDVFDAAFIFCYLRGWGLERTGKFANIAAALSTQRYGTRGYPKEEDVKKMF